MIFLDSNVIVHAFLKPRRTLSSQEKILKEKAKRLVQKIDDGKEVLTTVVHLSEIINIFGAFDKKYSREMAQLILSRRNIKIIAIDKDAYILALECSNNYDVDVNDCLAFVTMQNYNITEVYSFDKDFDKFQEIRRID